MLYRIGFFGTEVRRTSEYTGYSGVKNPSTSWTVFTKGN